MSKRFGIQGLGDKALKIVTLFRNQADSDSFGSFVSELTSSNDITAYMCMGTDNWSWAATFSPVLKLFLTHYSNFICENRPILLHIEMLFKIYGYICIELLCLLCKYVAYVAYVYNNTEENTFLSGRIMIKGEKKWMVILEKYIW